MKEVLIQLLGLYFSIAILAIGSAMILRQTAGARAMILLFLWTIPTSPIRGIGRWARKYAGWIFWLLGRLIALILAIIALLLEIIIEVLEWLMRKIGGRPWPRWP